MAESIEFMGERFAVADKIGLAPLIDFAVVANSGMDSKDMGALVAMKDLLVDCIAPEEWDRFWSHAKTTRADGEQLMGVVGKVFEALSARPTSQPSDSSAGLPSTPRNSGDASYLQVVERLEEQGRPDQALMVLMANEDRSPALAS